MGASITGVDFSDKAIKKASELAKAVKLEADFICNDVYSYGKQNEKIYDLVFTSYGVLCWLPDLDTWSNVINSALKEGGRFVMVEFHPINDLLAGYDYFGKKRADIAEEGNYTENCNGMKSKLITWTHSISDVIQSLIKAGLTIKTFLESPYSPYNCQEDMQFNEHMGYSKLISGKYIPQLYAIEAIKQK